MDISFVSTEPDDISHIMCHWAKLLPFYGRQTQFILQSNCMLPVTCSNRYGNVHLLPWETTHAIKSGRASFIVQPRDTTVNATCSSCSQPGIRLYATWGWGDMIKCNSTDQIWKCLSWQTLVSQINRRCFRVPHVMTRSDKTLSKQFE